jgi:hypothetical protein
LGDCLLWAVFFSENYKFSPHYWATFLAVTFLGKNGLGFVLGDFSGNHLVTLAQWVIVYSG